MIRAAPTIAPTFIRWALSSTKCSPASCRGAVWNRPPKKCRSMSADGVVLRALEQDPERRYQQASVFKTQVEAVTAAGAKAKGGGPDAGPSSLPRYQSVALVI